MILGFTVGFTWLPRFVRFAARLVTYLEVAGWFVSFLLECCA